MNAARLTTQQQTGLRRPDARDNARRSVGIWAARSAALVVSLLVLQPQLAAAAGGIPPGREADVLKLFLPFEDDGIVAGTVTLAGVKIGGDAIVVILRDPAPPAREATVRLEPKSRIEPGKSAFSLTMTPTTHGPLMTAQRALAAAIRRNDDGSFFRAVPTQANAADGRQRQPGAGQRDSPDTNADTNMAAERRTNGSGQRGAAIDYHTGTSLLTTGAEAWLAALLWALLLGVMLLPLLEVCRRTFRGPHRLRAAAQILGGVALLLLALRGRTALPFIPLHANHHAWEDLGILLDLPQMRLAVGRHLETYGVSWLMARRAILPIFGAHFDGVGLANAWWGATAVGLGTLAALGAGGGRIAVVVATLAMVWSPAGTWVAHSESDLVVGQWLLAAGLWLATRQGRRNVVGVAAAVGLLCLGHVVGPPLGLGLLFMAVALRPGRPCDATQAHMQAAPNHSATDSSATDSSATDSSATDSSDWLRTAAGYRSQWQSFVAIGAVFLVSAATRLWSAGSQVGGRLSATEQMIPLPLNPWQFSLWLDPGYAPSSLGLLAFIGLVSALVLRLRAAMTHSLNGETTHARRAWRALAGEIGLLVGVAVVASAGLVVCASLTDGLRYQSTLLAPLLLLAGRAGVGWRRQDPGMTKWTLGVVCGALMISTFFGAVTDFHGRRALDSQAQGWLNLRAALKGQTGTIHLLKPPRHDGQSAVIDVPQGPWSANGPTSVAIDMDAALIACQRGAPLPRSTYWIRFAACSAGKNVCAEAKRLRGDGAPIAMAAVVPVAALVPPALPGEFLELGSAVGPWLLAAAACPPQTGANSP